jgi:SNF2 family DNA or RNA helicase
MQATLEGDTIRVKFPYDPGFVTAIKAIPGRFFDPSTKTWTVPKRQYKALAAALPVRIAELDDYVPPVPPPHLAALIRSEPALRKLGGYPLMRHQRIGSDLIQQGNIGLFFDTGTGKTPTVLAAVERMMPLRCLVVCPLALVRGAWEEDVRKFLGDFPFLDLHGTPKAKRAKALRGLPAGIAAINYESFRPSIEDLGAWRPDMMVCDESSKAKNPQSDITKALLHFAAKIDPRVVLLSGTPAPNSHLEYFAQLRLLGADVPKSFYAWRARVAKATGFGGYEWTMTREGEQVLQEQLASCSWHVSKTDVLDLPERTFIVRHVELSKPERDAYEAMKKHMLAEIVGPGGEVTEVKVNMVLAQIAKLRQMTSGFTYGEGQVLVPTGTSKLDALVELLEEIGPQQVIVWACYHAEADAIRAALAKLGRYVEYHGRVNDADKHAALQAFKDGSARYLLASAASIGHGVTLTNCSYSVDFSMDYSYERFHQKNDRIYRFGQKNACMYFHIIARQSIDEVLHEVVLRKAEASASVLNFLKGR